MSGRIFGTDGMRGAVNQYPMTAEMAMKFAMAAGHHFTTDDYRHRVIIAKDTRLSGYLFEPALVSGFISVGMDVIMVGPMPTPAVPMLIKSLRADMGVMISASHNPHQDNGLKLFNGDGLKLNDILEDELQELILSNKTSSFLVAPEKVGRAKRLEDAPGRYIEHVKRSFPKGLSLAGLRVVLDCANGAAYNLAPMILWELGADVVKIACEPDGLNINLNCGSMHPEVLSQKVKETRADIGIALDGDADRVVICDEKGEVIHGDVLIGMIAANLKKLGELKGDGVVVTQMSNSALERYLDEQGIKLYRTPVGDRYVAEKLLEKKCNFGGEQSGHIIINDYSTTGDGVIAAMQVLAMMVRAKKPLSKISKLFDPFPQILKNIKFKNANPLEQNSLKLEIEKISEANTAERIIVRKSGTEKLIRVMVEGENVVRIQDIAEKLETIITKSC